MSDQKQTNANVNEDDDFTSTKGSGDSWNPKQNADKVPYARENYEYDATKEPNHKEKDILIGYLVDIRHGIGEHKSTVYTFVVKDENGNYTKKVDVWGDTVLNKEIEKVPSLNILVKLEWLGQGVKKDKKPGQKGAGFNKWEVGYKADKVLPGKVVEAKATTPEVEGETKQDAPAKVAEEKKVDLQNTSTATNKADDDDLPF